VVIVLFVAKEYRERRRVKVYDTTLRDGAQSELVSFSVDDKLRIAQKLDELGVHYIEGGFPSSNPKDREFFSKAGKLKLKAKLTAFGSTKKPGAEAEEDKGLKELLESKTSAVCIFGKSWDLHVKEVLKISPEENLGLIEETVKFLKEKGKEVIYDAEHFFDGYKSDARYALETLERAEISGADCAVLCDTNGGCLPFEVEEIVKKVREKVSLPIGMHMHNDSGNAAANTLMGVRCGAAHVQGTINGLGERCGNADLCTIIPNLELKMGITTVGKENLKKLTEVSRFVSETANLSHPNNLPYVGASAFAHKGGVHADAVQKKEETYEHVFPELVGNARRVLISELAGKANIIYKAKKLGFDLDKETPQVKELLNMLKALEHQGYMFDGADASFELLLRRKLKPYKKFFELEGFRTLVEKRKDGRMLAEATVRVLIENKEYFTAAEGNGPVNALDSALRKALEQHYPELKTMHLADYKVRVLDGKEGTAAKVRVLIESKDDKAEWGTVGVSENIIEASWEALADSIEYKLLKDKEDKDKKRK